LAALYVALRGSEDYPKVATSYPRRMDVKVVPFRIHLRDDIDALDCQRTFERMLELVQAVPGLRGIEGLPVTTEASSPSSCSIPVNLLPNGDGNPGILRHRSSQTRIFHVIRHHCRRHGPPVRVASTWPRVVRVSEWGDTA
jgi:hypothetical protein